jgi:hypothetical protein
LWYSSPFCDALLGKFISRSGFFASDFCIHSSSWQVLLRSLSVIILKIETRCRLEKELRTSFFRQHLVQKKSSSFGAHKKDDALIKTFEIKR